MAEAEFINPQDANGQPLGVGVSSYPKFQDGATPPLVSPQTAVSLTLKRPTGAVRLHVSCSTAFKVGQGNLSGSGAGNGSVVMYAWQWFVIDCAALATIALATSAGDSGVWSFCWDIDAGN